MQLHPSLAATKNNDWHATNNQEFKGLEAHCPHDPNLPLRYQTDQRSDQCTPVQN